MGTPKEAGATTMRGFAVAALALVGLAFSFTPLADRADAALLDLQWSVLRKFDPRPAPDDIIVVGIDERTVQLVAEPRGLWHEPLGRALARIASARPRAIGLDVALPGRSYEQARPGLDRALLAGLAAARDSAPFVAALAIDPRTRAARPIHPPVLAVLQEERLALGLLSRDVDGVTRRFSLAIPTEDGAFPTLAGRLCRNLARHCADGLIHYALGAPFKYVPLHQVLDAPEDTLRILFRDRIVMVGETQGHADRVEVPVNLAAWERPGRDSPSIVVHAQALRTALLAAAPTEASRPLVLVTVTLAALLVLVLALTHALILGLLGAVAFLVAGVVALRSGIHLPIAAPLATLLLAFAARAARSVGRRYEVRRR